MKFFNKKRKPSESISVKPVVQDNVAHDAENQTKLTNSEMLEKVKKFNELLSSPYVGREEEAKVITLALITKEHPLFLGDPGTGKSMLAERACDLVDARIFKAQFNEYTEPIEINGHISTKGMMEEDVIRYITKGMLPESDIAYCDEIFKASTAIRNTLLSIMNERKLLSGGNEIPAKTRMIIMASNEPPEDLESAFYDRLLLRHFVFPVKDDLENKLIAKAHELEFNKPKVPVEKAINLQDLDEVFKRIGEIDVSKVMDKYYEIRKKLSAGPINLRMSDRRMGKALKVVAAHAFLEGREAATVEDLIVLKYIVPKDAEELNIVSGVLEAELNPFSEMDRLRKSERNFKNELEMIKSVPIIAIQSEKLIKELSKAKEETEKWASMYANKELREQASKVLVLIAEITGHLNVPKTEDARENENPEQSSPIQITSKLLRD